jgi:hypothetical protein
VKAGPKSTTRLSEIDAAFLYMERREIPLSIAGVFVFDSPVPVEEFAREHFGGTVNDVILATVTGAIARYAKLHGQPFLPVVLPLDVDDPAEMLRAVSTRMDIMKSARAAELVVIASAWIGATPPPVQALFWEGLPLLPLPLFNLICTNIPGSSKPLCSLGHRMVASHPQLPTGQNLGVGVAVQSYDGKMFFGLTADAHAASDVKRLRDYLQTAFRDLSGAAGVKKPRPKASARPTAASAA